MKVLQDPPPNEPLTQVYIAKTLGLKRNTVSRRLKLLHEEKFILKEGMKIEVLIHV
jgi:DNA-binding Lrp family transcriptional regulator